MDGPRWRWTLANGAKVSAEIFTSAGLESVNVDDRPVSQCSRGKRPDGHVISAPPKDAEGETLEAVVTFDAWQPICVLRVDGQEVAPIEWPSRRDKVDPKRATPRSGPSLRWVVIVGLLIVLVVVALAVTNMRAPTRESDGLTASYRAPSGLFIAHHPSTMKVTPLALPAPFAGALIAPIESPSAIVIAAAKADAVPSKDPWVLQKQYLPEVLPTLPRGGGKLEEEERRDDTCLGERGAVVGGTLTNAEGQKSRLWSCTFVRENAAYLVLEVQAVPVTAAASKRLRAIIDATELTQLSEVAPPQ